MANDLILDDPFNPKKIYDDLIKRCKEVRMWTIRCIVDEAWIGPAPFDMILEDGIFTCFVVTPTLRQAYMLVARKLPVITFLDYREE
jgi:hypothetical protein